MSFWIVNNWRWADFVRRILATIFIGLWVVIMSVAFFGKWAMDGALSVWEHYTNISWFWQLTAYAFILAGEIWLLAA